MIGRLANGLPALIVACLALAPCRGDDSAPDSVGLDFFEKRIRPLLAEHCYSCHSTGKKQRGGLLLDSKKSILKGGDNGPLLVPRQPEKSRLIEAVRYANPDLRMPPAGKLTDRQLNDLAEWIKNGATMPEDRAPPTTTSEFDLEKRRRHWSFQPLRQAPAPQVRDTTWGRNPIDAFILAGLEAQGLKPAPEADRRTLLRRLNFDLTGLPPTPEEIRAFVADTAPDAYENVVTRLLSSPAYGERWARHWLDLVRYADTQGHEYDFDLTFAFQYRDYVVRALNTDLPYDQFVVEHLAGDLLPRPRRHPTWGINESILGTGFFFLGEAKHSPVDVRAEGADRGDNQIDVFAKTFLGLTVSCARCHDHKFDPISTRDYYALAGYLRSSRFQTADINPPELTRPAVARMQQALEKAQTLAIDVSAGRLKNALGKLTAEERERLRAAWPELTGLKTEKPADFVGRRAAAAGRLEEQQVEAKKVRDFAAFTAGGLSGWKAEGEAFGDRSNRASDAIVFYNQPLPVYRLLGPGGTTSGRLGIRLHGALRSPTFTIASKYILFRVAGAATRMNVIIDGFQLIREPIYEGLKFTVNHGDAYRWHVMDVGMWLGHRAYIEALDETDGYLMLDRVVFAADREPPAEPPNPLLVKLLQEPTDSLEKLDDRFRELLLETLTLWREGKLDARADGRARAALVNQLLRDELLQQKSEPIADEMTKRQQMQQWLEGRAQLEATLPRPTYAMALADGTGEDERVFVRGNHRTLGAEVPRRFLEVIAGKVQPAPREGSGRLEMARRIVEPSNVLLPRVMMNRLWHHHFGMGIVRSPDDFGHQGMPPTHPELLDWMARDFVQRGWSLKDMHRLMVTSSTYRMASRGDARAQESDPENRLWHRMPVRRLEGEAIRDALLSVSGRLERGMGGPGVLPHLTPHMQGRGRPGVSGPLDGDGRRSLYLSVRRNFLTPLFLAFDYPTPFTTIGRRSVSNVPAQALSLMNNPLVREQAELWARRVLDQRGLSDRQRIGWLYETAFGRLSVEDEVGAALEFLQEQEPKELKRWTELCHVLFNVKEFIFLH